MCSSSGRAVPLVPTDNENVVPLEKSDDLSSKYGIASDNVVCTKKRNKKLRSRPLGIEFPLHGNGLAREFLHNIGSNVSNMDQLNEFLATIEISEFERKILNDLLKSGHLQQLVEQSGLFDICSDGDRITLSSKRDEGAAVLKKPNIFQNLLRTTGVAVDSLSTGIMDGCAMTLHDVARGSIYSTPGGSVLNGQVLSNTRPSSADANRALMNYTAWSGNSLAHDIVQSTVGCKDAFTERLRQQLEERCNELARIKEQSAVLMVQTSKVLAEKEAVEKRLLDMESKLSQRNDCLQRE
ncbi:unnamed protein product [Toxocara canis]|uniref:Detected protein of confused Function n=1 Tax=Toxocara canis TaxID=6265 RepID=A0A183VB06_TOXCA|nr:unnamed protein product [Toxocara canis]